MKRRSIVLSSLLGAALACSPPPPPAADHVGDEGESWAVTAWGRRHEIFAETDALMAGQPAASHVHVTVLADFSPLSAGAVSAVLRSSSGGEQRFRQERPSRDGIFPVEIVPSAEGTFELAFVVESGGEPEEIPAGRVRVGSAASPGGLAGPQAEPADAVSFLKEQQWRTEFATAWVEAGALNESVAGPARVSPARGGSVVLTASVDAVVASEPPWPFVGLDVARGSAVFRLRPRIGDRSLPELTAQAAALEAEAETGRRRVERLEELLRLEATSAAELERAQAALAGSEARLAAARGGLAVASGASVSETLAVSAPWAGRVAEVAVSPGQSVKAGDVLGRLVKPHPLWIEVALRPEQAPRLKQGLAGLILRRASLAEVLEIEPSALRLVAIAPEVDPGTASIAATLEVDRDASELPIGSALEAEIVLAAERPGIVVADSALIDDSGVAIAYVQDSGESFSRRELRVVARQGRRVLVEGLSPGERLVSRGGAAIRRSSLLSSGAPEGHVH